MQAIRLVFRHLLKNPGWKKELGITGERRIKFFGPPNPFIPLVTKF